MHLGTMEKLKRRQPPSGSDQPQRTSDDSLHQQSYLKTKRSRLSAESPPPISPFSAHSLTNDMETTWAAPGQSIPNREDRSILSISQQSPIQSVTQDCNSTDSHHLSQLNRTRSKLLAPTASVESSKEVGNRHIERTFRVKGIPLESTVSDIKLALKNHFKATEGPNDEQVDVAVKSLATEAQGRRQVATINFRRIPTELLSGHEWTLENGDFAEIGPQRSRPWTVDDHFHGLTVLYSPPAEVHAVEYATLFLFLSPAKYPSIVAISGLGSHAYGSFKEKGGKHMWLSDSLPYDISPARIAIYGYSSGLENSTSVQTLDDLGNSLQKSIQTLKVRSNLSNGLAALCQEIHQSVTLTDHRRECQPRRPIIFIAHSLGGLIVKEVCAYVLDYPRWHLIQLCLRLLSRLPNRR